jgi:hypothetical protein
VEQSQRFQALLEFETQKHRQQYLSAQLAYEECSATAGFRQ